MIELLQGDCLEKLKLLDDNSIDALVTDPPAGIGFMGKEWDKDKGGRDGWIAWLTEIMVEAMRTMKPGAHGLVWALPRTSHWTAMALEDAGFEVRDCVYHVFGSGFPKSLNVGKAIDKLEGNEREVVGTEKVDVGMQGGSMHSGRSVNVVERDLTRGHSAWEGWGTALKPAVECWWLVRKPLGESTVAKNVLEYGTGALNIDASRIETAEKWEGRENPNAAHGVAYLGSQDGTLNSSSSSSSHILGRWPSHLIHDGSDEILEHFPQTTSSGDPNRFAKTNGGDFVAKFDAAPVSHLPGDSGSAARFFKTCAPSLKHDNMSVCKHISANIVAKVLMTTQATPDPTAHANVEDLQDEQLVQNVKSATTGCPKCVTLIVQELVRIKNSASSPEGLQAIQDSIGNLGNSTLTQNLVEIVERWASTDIIPTTTNLLTLFGSVLLAIDENTSSAKQVAVGVDSDQATATRFLYCAKPSRAERNAKLDGFEKKLSGTYAQDDYSRKNMGNSPDEARQPVANFHPTVKAQSLMRYLITLITPPNGTVLDMFMGSGSTGVAAKALGFGFVGVELEQEYFEIAKARIDGTKFGEPLEFDKPVEVDENQLDLFGGI